MKLIPLILCVLSSTAFAMDWQGHRGARGIYPENTIGGMEEALKYNVTTLEMDVVMTKDKKIILSHEPWINGKVCLAPNGKTIKDESFQIYKLTHEEIVRFDCGSLKNSEFPEQLQISTGKPTLEKVIEVIEAKKQVHYSIEIKYSPEWEKRGLVPNVKEFSESVMSVLKKKLPYSRYTIQSFSFEVLRYIHDFYPDVQLSALTINNYSPGELKEALGFLPRIYSPLYKKLAPHMVKEFHAAGMKVIPWTVNELSVMEELVNLKVDGIITDYPNLISRVGEKKCKEGENLFENKCVKIPAHAVASSNPPGWVCKSGRIQKRNSCIKVLVPEGGSLLPDGKTWECNVGYERYRGLCRKK